MSYSEEGVRNCVKYRLLGSSEAAGSWGHEYVRHLSGELIAEYDHLSNLEQSTKVIIEQALELVPFFLKHNAEADACDLLIELELLEKLGGFVDKETYARVCLYIVG